MRSGLVRYGAFTTFHTTVCLCVQAQEHRLCARLWGLTGTYLLMLKPAATLSAATKFLLAKAVETLHSNVKAPVCSLRPRQEAVSSPYQKKLSFNSVSQDHTLAAPKDYLICL